MKAPSFALFLACASTTAAAQQADTDAILKAIQGLSGRIDGMQKSIDATRQDVDRLKSGAGAPAPSTTSGTQQRPVPQAPAMGPGRPQPGWVIDVLPMDRGDDPPRLLRFNNAKNPITLADHERIRQTQKDVFYRGSAKLNIYESGAHIFELEHANANSICSAKFLINKRSVVEFSNHGSQTRIFNGSINLDAGNYDVDFQYGCINGTTGRLTFKASGPTDNISRDLTGKDVFHLVSASPSNASPTAGDDVRLSAGMSRRVTAEVNVRNQPGATSSTSLVGKLQPGQEARVARVVSAGPDGDWAHIEVNGRLVGYIKTTALIANSQ